MLAAVTVVGVVLLIAALPVSHSGVGDWLSGVLVNVGTTVLLVVPLYLFERRLGLQIDEVRNETKSDVKAIAERVSTFEDRVERRLDEVAASVSARLHAERDQDVAAFDALVETPTWQGVYEALRRADELGLISRGRGPRVLASEYPAIFVRIDFKADPDWTEEAISFVVETFNGTFRDEVRWEKGEEVEKIMVRVGRAIHRWTSGEDLDVRAIFRGLRDALMVARTDPERRPIWQLCPPQWAVTPDRVITYGNAPHYGVSIEQLRRDPRMTTTHVPGKTWVDADSFHHAVEVAFALCEPPF